jgi:cellulose synthase/poly-beta-1,6-N-acetylglucosamine synthase-like glycosyltransferase
MLISILAIWVGIVITINLIRMMFFLIGSEFYTRWQRITCTREAASGLPPVLIITPARNESATIEACLESVAHIDYPEDLLYHLIVDDGSTDDTAAKVTAFAEAHPRRRISVLTVENGGKAHALNAGLREADNSPALRHVNLAMCLDADSGIAPDAITHAVKYFANPNVMMLASHVKIIPQRSLLNFVQRFEYLTSYRMKRAQSVFGSDYIVGGIGSMFRRDEFRRLGYYETNTVTEDIDASMKVIQHHGNQLPSCVYAADVITYTEACPNLKSLLGQRFRWKWGRCQTFLKRRSMFFSSDRKFTRLFSWFLLPLEIFYDVMFLLEPIVIAFVGYVVIRWADWVTLLSAMGTVGLYMMINAWREPYYAKKDRLLFALSAPLLYFLNYVLSYAEYAALLKTIVKLPSLRKSLSASSVSWVSPDRSGAPASATTARRESTTARPRELVK